MLITIKEHKNCRIIYQYARRISIDKQFDRNIYPAELNLISCKRIPKTKIQEKPKSSK